MDIFHMYSDNILFKSLKFLQKKNYIFHGNFYHPHTHLNLTIIYFLANYLTYEFTWADTFDVIKKKVLSDAQSHGYFTSVDDILSSWKDYTWYNTGLNPIQTVTFNAGRKTQLKHLPYDIFLCQKTT